MRLIAVTLLLGASLVNAQQPDWQPLIDEITDSDRARSVVVGIYDDGDTHTLVAGSPGGPSSIFEIGSITKVFTSLLAQLQVDAKRLSWNQTLAETLPSLTFANDAVASITLRELSTHTSGLPRLPANMNFDNPDDPYAGYDRKLLLEFLAEFDPAALNKSYEYSNLGAGLLGEIAADAAGASYSEAMRRDVLLPLSMQSSYVGLNDGLAERLVAGFSNGADMPNWSGFDALAGAGAITSSVDDMLTFIDMNLNDSSLAAALAAIRDPQGDTGTALGWQLQQREGETLHWHNGGTGGYASFVGINVAERKGIAILSASTDYTGITELGFQILYGEMPAETDDDFSTFEGVYQLSEAFYLTIFEKNRRLQAQASGQAAFTLTPGTDGEYRFDAASITIRFPENDGEPVEFIEFSQAGNSIDAPRVDDSLGSMPLKEVDVDPGVLGDYAGQYQLAPGAIFTITARDGQLYAQLTGQPSYPVFAFDTDKFFYKIVDAKIYFKRDDNNAVTSLTLDQGGLQTAPRIGD